MSNKAPLYDVTKVHIKADISAETKARLDKARGAAGLSVSAFVSAVLDSRLAGVPLSDEDRARVGEIVAGNAAKRGALKARKGIR